MFQAQTPEGGKNTDPYTNPPGLLDKSGREEYTEDMTAYGTAIIRTKTDGSIKIMDVELEESRDFAKAQADRWNAKALPKNIRWTVIKIELMEG